MDRMEVIEENEEWTQISETDEYEVTRSGRIRNAKTKKELHGTIDSQGRVKVYLTIHGKSCCKILSRIIAETYFGKEVCCGKDVYHKNGNKLKNEVNNLAVGTRSDSMRNSYKTRKSSVSKIGKPLECVETGFIFMSIEECSECMGISRNAISRSANNPRVKTRDGYHFRFLSDIQCEDIRDILRQRANW